MYYFERQEDVCRNEQGKDLFQPLLILKFSSIFWDITSSPTDDSEVHVSTIFRVAWLCLLLASCWFFFLTYFLTLKMEVTYSSKTSVDFQQTTQLCMADDGTLHNHSCEKLKPHVIFSGLFQTLLSGSDCAVCNGRTITVVFCWDVLFCPPTKRKQGTPSLFCSNWKLRHYFLTYVIVVINILNHKYTNVMADQSYVALASLLSVGG
jgi:hypothetical protein